MKNLANKIILAVVILLLCGLFFALKEAEKVSKRMQENKEFNPYGITLKLEDGTGIAKAVHILLEKSGNAITGGCPVDENFYYWISKNYGNDVVCDVAYQVNSGLAAEDIWENYTGLSLKALYGTYCTSIGFDSGNAQEVAVRTGTASDNVISFVGDINLADDWMMMKGLRENGGTLEDAFTPEMIDLLNRSAVTMINNEFVFSEQGEPMKNKTYTFRSQVENVSMLQALGVDIVSLANNHVYDFGEVALEDTFATLKENNITYVGAGMDLNEAMQPRYYLINGKRVAIVSATQIEITSNKTRPATETQSGVLKTVDPTLFCKEIKEAKRNADYVIVYVHWGWEGKNYTDGTQKDLAKEYIEAGADAIIGNHAHRMQGVQYISGVPIINSLGNFWMTNSSQYAMVAQVHVNDSGLSVSLVPCLQSKGVARVLLSDEAKEDFFKYVADLSTNIAIQEDGTVVPYKGEPNGKYVYYSGQNYEKRDPDKDVYGNSIDSVGILK